MNSSLYTNISEICPCIICFHILSSSDSHFCLDEFHWELKRIVFGYSFVHRAICSSRDIQMVPFIIRSSLYFHKNEHISFRFFKIYFHILIHFIHFLNDQFISTLDYIYRIILLYIIIIKTVFFLIIYIKFLLFIIYIYINCWGKWRPK